MKHAADLGRIPVRRQWPVRRSPRRIAGGRLGSRNPASASLTWAVATASLPGGLPNQAQSWSESTTHPRWLPQPKSGEWMPAMPAGKRCPFRPGIRRRLFQCRIALDERSRRCSPGCPSRTEARRPLRCRIRRPGKHRCHSRGPAGRPDPLRNSSGARLKTIGFSALRTIAPASKPMASRWRKSP